MLWFRGFIFTILIPGSVAGLIPFLLILNRKPDLDWGGWHLAGFPVIIAGIMIYLITAISFLIRGKGTPAIWFTRAVSWLIGHEPVRMVSSGLYKYSRNPMYLGVMITVLGEGIFLGYKILLLYCLVLFFIFHFIVVLIEEPHLSRKFGNEYEAYKKKTRRWF
jgi:protein-S-isoprenylcysteine O-methyltransferase Ste14